MKISGDVSLEVQELSQKLNDAFSKALHEGETADWSDVDLLKAQLERLGFQIALLAQQEADGSVKKMKLCVMRVGNQPSATLQ